MKIFLIQKWQWKSKKQFEYLIDVIDNYNVIKDKKEVIKNINN